MKRDRLKGYTCECCAQLVKEYNRPMYKTQLESLIKLYALDKMEPGKYWHITRLNTSSSGGDFAKLRYWDLIMPLANDNPKKKHSGRWRITRKGKQFAGGRRRLPKYARVYNKELLFLNGPLVTVSEAYGKGFDYEELMK